MSLLRPDSSAIIKKLSFRSLKTAEQRNLFIIITISFVTTQLAAIFFAASGKALQLEKELRGNYQAFIAAAPQELVDELSVQPEIGKHGILNYIGYSPSRYKESTLAVTYEDKYFLALRPPVKGRLPEAENEILVENSFLDYCGLPQETNQSIVLNLKDGEEEYTVQASGRMRLIL